MAGRREITARITGQLVSIADGREFEFVCGDVMCGSQTGLGGEGAAASSQTRPKLLLEAVWRAGRERRRRQRSGVGEEDVLVGILCSFLPLL